MGTTDIVILGLYLAGMLVLGFIARGKIQTLDDFILGGRRFTTVALVGTIMATMVGSGMSIGAVGNAYQKGAGGTVLWMYAGFAVGLFFFGAIAGKIRATGKRTMAEVIAAKFGNTPRLVASIIIIAYAISIVAINIAGFRTVILYVFGSELPLSIPVATAVAAFIAIIYTSMGGFYAVVWSDVIQLTLMLLGIFILGPIIGLKYAGGFGVIRSAYTDIGSSITNPFINGISSSAVGFFLAYFLTVPGDPTMPQRALAARDTRSASRAYYISGVLGLYFGVALLLIGGASFVLMPGLANHEAALPTFVVSYFPPVLVGLTIAAIIATIMSSFDSFLILATTHLIYDVGQSVSKQFDENTIKKVMPFATLGIGLLGLVIALFIQELFGYLYMVFSIVGSALVPALIGALYFENWVTKAGVITSMVVGTLVPAGLYLTVGYDVFLGDPVFLGIFSSIAALIIVSALTGKSRDSTQEQA